MNERANGKLRVLTHSEVQSFQECERKHNYRYTKGRRPVVSAKALLMGTAWHLAQERRDRGADPWAGNRLDCDYDQAKLEAMHEAHAKLQSPIKATHLEQEMVDEMGEFKFAGAFDKRGVFKGKPYIVERKTTSLDISPGSNGIQSICASPQGVRYVMLARRAGIECAGYLMDIVRKPRIKPFKATEPSKRKYKACGALYKSQRASDETPMEYKKRCFDLILDNAEAYLSRVTVEVSDDDVSQAVKELSAVARTMEQSERWGVHPRNWGACFRWGGACEYFAVCKGDASIDDDAIFRTTKKQHEELQL